MIINFANIFIRNFFIIIYIELIKPIRPHNQIIQINNLITTNQITRNIYLINLNISLQKILQLNCEFIPETIPTHTQLLQLLIISQVKQGLHPAVISEHVQADVQEFKAGVSFDRVEED